MSESTKELLDLFNKEKIQRDAIFMTEGCFNELLEVIEKPPEPSPALRLAIEKARRRVNEGRNP
jgi:uncharacterized protein (DUF1778 family)